MTLKQNAEGLVDKYYNPKSPESLGNISIDFAKQCALIAVDRNIIMFTELVNKMGDFSNESREIIWQLIENEEKMKQEIENL